jgi:N-acetylglutamate synthase-like GNAT family acetyltransferase
MITFRPAAASDQERIVEIIRAAQINPMDLKWPNFVVAEDDTTRQIVATGQIKTHGDKSRELASIAVIPEYRGQGLARRIIEHLLAENTGVLYLTCRSVLGPLYEKFGFRAVLPAGMTPYFRRLSKVAATFMFLARTGETLLVMKRDG